MGDGVSRTSFDTVATKDATIVVDVVDLRVALASADALAVSVFRGFNIDAIGRAGGRAKKARDALLKTVFVALKNVRTAKALLEACWPVGIVFGYGGL